MKRAEYCCAIDKLEFSENLAARVRAKANKRPQYRMLSKGMIAAVLSCLMITTTFAAVSILRQRPARVVPVGTEAIELNDTSYMEFSMSDMTTGVRVHTMELGPKQQYSFRHSMLWNSNIGFHYITDDYQLQPVEMNRVNLTLEKNERIYNLDFTYVETEQGVISNHRSVYSKDENGEILLNATDGNSDQWPVYLHVESGSIRDALPDWSASDFEGRVGYGYSLMGGILICSIVNEDQPNARNILYWIDQGAEEAKTINLPGNGHCQIEKDTVFYQNEAGQLYRMNEDFDFELICEYMTMDILQDGLLIVSVNGKLGILDAYTGELYVLEEISAFRWDTVDYCAIRYGAEGTIALAKTEWRHEPERRVLCSLGVLDKETGELKLLEIEHDCDGYQHNWLDEHRFAVIYRLELGQILCVYEFDA